MSHCLFCSETRSLQAAEFYVRNGTWVARNPILKGSICRVCSGQFKRFMFMEVAAK